MGDGGGWETRCSAINNNQPAHVFGMWNVLSDTAI